MKDKKLEAMKRDYENIRIPKDLRERVEIGIQKGKEESGNTQNMKGKGEKAQMKEKSKVLIYCRRIVGGVAAALLAITILTNSGTAIAHAMENIPVIGAIAKVVTFREYKDSTNGMEADVKIPEVRIENEDGAVNQESTDQINKSIQEYTDEIIARYEADVESAGGEGHMEVDVDYTVITDNERLFSIRFDQLLVMASGEQKVKIYHVDKQTGEMISLADIFKEGVNFIDPVSGSIKEQMKERMAADENIIYWLDSEMPEWDFKSITEDAVFYINEDGKLVIVFDEYEVAPGFMGSQEFEIPTEVVQDIVREGFVD